jgi:nucleolar protein 56
VPRRLYFGETPPLPVHSISLSHWISFHSALKTKGNTPKYGIIYHSSFIGRASAKNKGRISRYLANKCSIASRVDSFIDEPTNAYGLQLREQVEERLTFYDNGTAPRKNIDVMESVASNLRSLAKQNGEGDDKKSKKRKVIDDDEEIVLEAKDSKKKSKDKKKKVEEVMEVEAAVEETPGKKKKSKKAEVEVEEVAPPTDKKKKKKEKA